MTRDSQVTVRCSAASADAPPKNRVALRCNPADRKVWVERAEAATKIVFSSTYDAVINVGSEGGAAVDISDAASDAASALYKAAIAPAVAAALEGRAGIVLCIGYGVDKRQALFDACTEVCLPTLLGAAKDKSGSLTACALNLHWEQLVDLLDDDRNIDGPPPSANGATGGGIGPGGGLLGAFTRVVASAEEGVALLRSLPSAAAHAEEKAVGAAGGGHLAVQLALVDATGSVVGRLLLIDAAELRASSATSELVGATLCNSSEKMLMQALAKPASRPPAADATLLVRLMAPAFDTPASVTARLVLNVTADAPKGTVEVLRTAQAAAKVGKVKAKGDSEARRLAVTDYLQKKTVKAIY